MESIYRFMAKNRVLSLIMLILIICPLYFYLLWSIDAPEWLIIVLEGMIIFAITITVNSATARLLKKPLDELGNNCDPTPLLEMTTELLGYKNTKIVQQTILMDHGVALREFGEFQRNYEILKSINVDENSGIPPITKVVYYNNLSDACSCIGDDVQAEIWYQKMIQIYNGMPENKAKKKLDCAVKLSTAEAWYRRNDFEQALNTLRCVEPTQLAEQVGLALSYAEVFVKLNNYEEAIANIRFVIANGNKLFAVKRAYELLNVCNSAQSGV